METTFSKSAILFLLTVMLLSPALHAQVPLAKAWDNTLGGESDDYLEHIIATPEGGFLLAGYSGSGLNGNKTSKPKGDTDYWVVKLRQDGSKEWDRTFGGSGTDVLKSVIRTSDGGYLLGGFSSSGIRWDKSEPCRGEYDYWVVKIGSDGTKQWDRTFGTSNYDYLESLAEAVDGGYLLSGSAFTGVSDDKTDAGKGRLDYWVIKIRPDGSKEWDKSFGGSGDDILGASIPTADGGFLLGGSSLSGTGHDKSEALRGNMDYWLVKLNSAGEKEWDKTLGARDADIFTSLAQTPTGDYLAGGHSESGIGDDKTESSKGGYDLWLVKLKGDGTKVWDKTFGGSSNDHLATITVTENGGCILGGHSYSDAGGDKTEGSRGDADFWAVQLNSSGAKLWDSTLGGSGGDYMTAIVATASNGYLLGGMSTSGISGDKTEESKGLGDFWLVKYGRATEPSLQCSLKRFSLYPNPTSGKVRFILGDDCLQTPYFDLVILNAIGQELKRKYKVSTADEVDISELASGMYMFVITFEDNSQIVEKVVKGN